MVNDRFIKFGYEKSNSKTNFTNNKIVHILFYSENDTLLSKALETNKDLLNFFKKIIVNKSTNSFLVRSEKGNFLLIRRKTENNELTLKYLQNLGGSIFDQIKSIDCSEAKIYEDDSEIIKQVCLGFLLGSYKFDNYKFIKPKDLINLKKVVFVSKKRKKEFKNFSTK